MGSGVRGKAPARGAERRCLGRKGSDPLFDGGVGGKGGGIEGHVVVGVGARDFDAGFLGDFRGL